MTGTLAPVTALALPQGGTVAAGSATVSTPTSTSMRIDQATDRLIMDWTRFNIAANEAVRFQQPSAASIALNRVSSLEPSMIFGSLSANGQVMLVNPGGILFGPGSRVDVGALTASTLNITNQDFLTSRYRFTQDPNVPNAAVVNQGLITAGPGGYVALLGAAVRNEGVIQATRGSIALGAGSAVTLDLRGDDLIGFVVSDAVSGTVTGPNGESLSAYVSNTGTLQADGGMVILSASAAKDFIATAVNQEGFIRAQTMEERDGRIFLSGGDQGLVTISGAVDASGANTALKGGSIDVQGHVVIQTGSLHADGASGGSIAVQAHNILQAGTVTADGATEAGGTVNLVASGRFFQTSSALVSTVGGASGDGGNILVTAGPEGMVFTSATLTATGQHGGTINLLGHNLILAGAALNVSGELGGGTVLVGGDYHGQNTGVLNASSTFVNATTTINADALTQGDGGKVIVWADEQTHFYGTSTARGGADAGNGGFIEISSKDMLTFGGFANAAAVNGHAGTVLFDPKNITIDASGGGLSTFQLLDPHPAAGDQFGAVNTITVLPNDNVVITDPNDDLTASNAGAVHLFNGTTGALISTLTGSTASDQVGNGAVTVLTNGNYVVRSTIWDNGAVVDVGAVTFGRSTTGVSGVVSAANSLVGSTASDQVGSTGVTALTNGNYVVRSHLWDNGAVANAGAATFGSGTTGISGVVSAANSLVGSTASDQVGNGGVTALTNGNYVVSSTDWDNGAASQAGAATFGSGTTGITGAVSSANSLVGGLNDGVGSSVTALTNGNYVVGSPGWDNGAVANAGAATFGSGTTGISGAVSAANSLVGSNSFDSVGNGGVTALTNGNYVVRSPNWNNGAVGSAGAVTFGSGTTGITGAVSAANSLVGSTASDQVGNGGVTALPNGNYVVRSLNWDNGAVVDAGAVTFGSGTTGITGAVSAANSLVGSTASDQVGSGGIIVLANGNYLVSTSRWDNGAVVDAGAVTFGSGTTGITGVVSAANSLVGSTASDFVGFDGTATTTVTALTNGNYVVTSQFWDNGAVQNVGAVTFGSGTTGISGVVSAANSLVGGTLFVFVGSGGVTALSNGNYVVSSPSVNSGRGAVTFGSGTTGITGVVSAANSLVGSTASDQVGSGGITALSNGNYVVRSPLWDNGAVVDAGAVTFGSGTTGISGVVSAANSLVGSTSSDQVGSGGVTALSNGNYVVRSPLWNNGAVADAGAVTLGSGTAGITGAVSAANSLVGSTASDQVGSGGITALSNGNIVVGSPLFDQVAGVDAGRVDVVIQPVFTNFANPYTFASDSGLSATITPSVITSITNTGTAVVLQASNDITLAAASNITTSAGGAGGALTMQAGRSVLLNSNITTDHGNLTLVANETVANGVINAQRDAGAAVITMASGTTINTSGGNISMTVSTGAGLTNSTSGALTVATLNAGAGNVTLQGTGAITETGTIAGNLLTANSVGGTTLTNPSNAVSSFNATNTTSGTISLTNTASPLTITGISQSGGGNVTITNTGGISGTGNSTVTGGNLTLVSTGAITYPGIISASTLTTSSAGGTVLSTGGNTVSSFNATNTTSGTISLTNTASPLTITGISQSGGGNVTITNTGAIALNGAATVAGGNLIISSTGAVTQTAPISASGLEVDTFNNAGAAITLTNSANDVSALLLLARNAADTADAAGAISYRDATGFGVTGGGQGIQTTSTVTLTAGGAITQTDPISASSLTVKTLNNAGAAITLNHPANDVSTVSLQARNAADSVNAPGAVSYRDASGFDVALIGTTGTATLTAGGAITQTGAISGTTLTTSSVGGTTLNGANTVTSFNATNSGSSGGAIQLTNTAPTLTITGINNSDLGVFINNTGAIVTTGTISAPTFVNLFAFGAGGSVTVGAPISTVSGGIGLQADAAVTVNANLSSVSGVIDLQANTDVTVNANVDAGSGRIHISADSDGNGTGTFTLLAGKSLTTTNSTIVPVDTVVLGVDHTYAVEIGAADIVLDGTISAVNGDVAVSVNQIGRTIGLGTVVGQFTLDNTEISHVTTSAAGTFHIGSGEGPLTVSGVSVGANNLLLAGTTINDSGAGTAVTTTGQLTLISNGAIGGASGGGDGLTVSVGTLRVNSTGGNDITITYPPPSGNAILNNITTGGAGNININKPTVQLTAQQSVAGDSISTSGDITLSTSGGAITLNEPVTATGAGNITINAGGNIPAFSLLVGAPMTAGSGTTTLNGRDGITLNDSVNGGSGRVIINADTNANGGTFTLAAGKTITTTNTSNFLGAGPIAVQISAADIDLQGTITPGTNGDVGLFTIAGRTVGVGSGAGLFSVSNAEVNNVNVSGTGVLKIGGNTSGALHASGVNFTGSRNLVLVTGSTIDDDGTTNAAVTTTGHLGFSSSGAIGGSSGSDGFTTNVASLGVFSSGGNNVTVTDVGINPLTIGKVFPGGAVGITTGGGGNVSITKFDSDLTVSQAISTSGDVTLLSLNGSLTTSGSGTVTTTGAGAILLRAFGAGHNVTVGAGITTGSGNIVLHGADSITLNDNVNAGSGTVLMDADANADGIGTFTLAGGKSITTTNTSDFLTNGNNAVQIAATSLALNGTITVGTNGSVGLVPQIDGTTIGVGTGAGAFSVSNAAINNVSVSGTGFLNIGDSSSGALRAAGVTFTGGRNLALLSGSTIDDDGTTNAAVTTTGKLGFQSGGVIGGSSGSDGFTSSVGGLGVTSSGGNNITITNTAAGGLTIGGTVGGTSVGLATGGAGNINITQSTSNLTVAQPITTSGNVALTSTLGTLVTSGSGSIDTTSGAGSINLQAAAGISIDTHVTATSGTITLSSDTDATGAGTLTLGPNALVTSANTTTAAITLRVADLVFDTSGTSDLLASTAAVGGGLQIFSSNPTRPMNFGSGVGSGINLSNAESFRITGGGLGSIVNIGEPGVQTGDIVFTNAGSADPGSGSNLVINNTSSGKVVLNDSGGIALNFSNDNYQINAGNSGILVAGGSGTIATTGTVTLNTAGPIGTSTNRLQFDNTRTPSSIVIGQTSAPASGGVFLQGLGSLTLGAVTTANVPIDVQAVGNLTATGNINSGAGTIFLFADSDANGVGTFTLTSGNSIATTNTTIVPVSSVTIGSNDTFAVELHGADIDLQGTINSGGDVLLGVEQVGRTIGIGTGAGAFNVSNSEINNITATGTIFIGQNTLTAGALTMDGVTAGGKNIFLAGAGINDSAVGTAVTTTGQLTFLSAGAIGGASAGGDGLTTNVGTLRVNSSNGNNITITNTGGVGPLTLQSIATGGAGNISITQSANNLTVSQPITTSGNVAVATNGGTSNLIIGAGITSGNGPITLNAGQDLLQTAGTVTTAGGGVTASAGRDITQTSGAIIQDTGVGGTILLTAGRNVSLALVSNIGGAMNVTATAGSINETVNDDAGAINIELAVGGNLSLTASTGIGTASFLDLGAPNVALATTNTGGIRLRDATTPPAVFTDLHTTGAGNISLATVNDATLTSVVAANGSITVNAGGNITATNVISSVDSDANDISITASAGDITVKKIISGGNFGDVTVQATTGSILRAAGAAATDLIDADVLTLTAQNGIGQVGGNGPLRIDPLTASAAVSGAGLINLQTSGGGTMTSLTTANGPITMAFGNCSAVFPCTVSNATSATSVPANAIAITGTTTNGPDGVSPLTIGTLNAGPLGNVTLQGTNVAITETGGITGALLTTSSVGGTTLNGVNTVSSFNAANSGSGNIALINTGTLGFTGINQTGGNLTITNTGALTQTAPITVTGTSSFSSGANAITLTQNNDFTGAVVLSNSGANAVQITDTNALVLGTSTVGQNLTVTAGGILSQTGALTVPGTLTLTTTHNAGDVVMNNAGAAANSTTLGNVTIGNNFTLTTNGNFSQVGGTALLIPGNFSVTGGTLTNPQAGNVITGTDSSAGGASIIRQQGIIDVGTLSQTVAGNLSVQSVPSLSSFGAPISGSAINLNNAANNIGGAITITTTHPALIPGGADVTTGIVQNSGALTVGGTASFSAAASTANPGGAKGDITLNRANDFTGAVSLDGNNVSVTDTNAIVLGTVGAVGTVGVTAGGAITQTGTITGTTLTTSSVGGTTLNLANAVTAFNATNTTSGNIALTNTANPLTITGISQSGGGNVTVAHTGNLTTSGTVTTVANGNIILSATGDETLGADIAPGGTGIVALSAGGAITQTVGTIQMSGGALQLIAGAGIGTGDPSTGGLTAPITTTGLTNLAAATTNNGIYIQNSDVTNFNITSVTTSLGTTTGLTAIGTNGAVSLSLPGGGSFTVGRPIAALNIVNISSGDRAGGLTGDDITVNSNVSSTASTVQLAVGDNIVLNSGAAISSGGTCPVCGTMSLILTTNNGGNDSFGSIQQNAGATLSANSGTGNLNATALAGIALGIAAGDGSLNVAGLEVRNSSSGGTPSGLVRIANTGGTLNLVDQNSSGISVANPAGSVSISTSGTLTIANPVSANTTITLNAGGTITQSAAISGTTLTTTSVGGTTLNNANTVSSFNATNTGSGNIALTNTANPLTITGISETGGGNVTVTNTGAITVNGSTTVTGGNLTLTSTGTITQTSAISANTLTTSSVGGTTLNNANTVSSFNATNTTSGNIALTNTANLLTITGISQTGTGLFTPVTINNTGALAVTGLVTATNLTNSGTNVNLQATGDVTIGSDVLVTGTPASSVIIFTTGANALLSHTGGTIRANNVNGTVQLGADRMALSGGTISAVNSGSGQVSLSRSNPGSVNLGSTVDSTANTLELSNAELNTISADGQLLISGTVPITVTAPVNLASLAGRLQLSNDSGTVGRSGNIAVNNSLTVPGGVLLLTDSAITGGGAINAGSLETHSQTGTTLTGANTVSSFTASNDTSGNISLTNTANPLTIFGISNGGGGNITVTNAGAVVITANPVQATGGNGGITITADDLALSAPITGSGGLVLQPSTASSSIGIGTGAPGSFNLNSTEIGFLADGFSSITIGRTDGSGTITVQGPVTFKDPLTIQSPVGGGEIVINGTLTGSGNASINVIGPGDTTILNGNIVTAGNAITISDRVILGANVAIDSTDSGAAPAGAQVQVAGTVNADGANARGLTITSGATGTVLLGSAVGNTTPPNNLVIISGEPLVLPTITTIAGVNLDSGGTITQAGPITTNTLTTQSVGGTTLNLANNVRAFNTSNTTSGNIALTNTANPLTVTGISESGGGSVTITNTGGLTLNGNETVTGGNLTLTAAGGAITQSGGTIAANLLTTGSAGGTTLSDANTVSSFNATNSGNGNIALTNTAPALSINGISQTGGGDVSVNNLGSVSSTGVISSDTGAIALSAGGGLHLDAEARTGGNAGITVTVGAPDDVALKLNAGTAPITFNSNGHSISDLGILDNGGLHGSSLTVSAGSVGVLTPFAFNGPVTLNAGGAITGTGGITSGGNLTLNGASVGNAASPLILDAVGGLLGGTVTGASTTDVFNIKFSHASDVNLNTITAIAGGVPHDVTIDSTGGTIGSGISGENIITTGTVFLAAQTPLDIGLRVETTGGPVFCNGGTCSPSVIVTIDESLLNKSPSFGDVVVNLISTILSSLASTLSGTGSLLSSGVLPEDMFTEGSSQGITIVDESASDGKKEGAKEKGSQEGVVIP